MNPTEPAHSSAPGASALSTKQLVDAGMAFTLVFVILQLFQPQARYPTVLALLTLLLTMTAPALLRLPARGWYRFSELLGFVMSRVTLGMIFFVVIVPVGFVVNRVRGDVFRRKGFRKTDGSVFVDRKHCYRSDDLKHPY